MMRVLKKCLLSILLVMATPAVAEEPLVLFWEQLMPEGEYERLDELYAVQQGMAQFGHSESDPMMGGMPVQTGSFNVVPELDGKLVRIPGFVLPFEYSASGEISEFLLVPYFGACIHTPPPPPNQMVYVTAKEATDLGGMWNAIWAIGILRTEKHLNDLGNAAYTLEFQRWEVYDG
ncbi:MAG: DUF3299 domain-containing protein [Pseudomonadota bacterium]